MNRISDERYNELWTWTQKYINDNCIVRNTKMPAKKKGDTYTWMFYLRRGLFNAEFMINIGQMFIYKMERLDPTFNFQITGLETAATPKLSAIPMVAKVMTLMRL